MIEYSNMLNQQAQQSTLGQLQPVGGYYGGTAWQAPQGLAQFIPLQTTEPKKEIKSMVKEIKNDMQAFMKEHKSIIYWTLILYVVDHYCFDGALKERLQKMVHNLVGKVEAKLDKAAL